MIYENIRALREQNHLTQTQLAQKLHMAQNTYSQYETGKIEWTAPPLDSACAALRGKRRLPFGAKGQIIFRFQA